MTPYARCSARLSRQRDAENAAWAARGDPRVTGDAARERMHDAVLAKPASELLAEMLERLRKAINKVRYA